MLGVDILFGLAETCNKNKYILVLRDYLTRWGEAVPLKKMDAKSIAELLIDVYFTFIFIILCKMTVTI